MTMLAMSDPHCGAFTGLTPPRFQMAYGKDHDSVATIQREGWAWFAAKIKSIGPVDLLALNADLIDGVGYRSGSTEQSTTDRDEQSTMAAEIINLIAPRKIIATFGTAYHTGEAEDWEKIAVRKCKARNVIIEDHAYFKYGGVTFDMKHHIGTSQIPHGRATAISREMLWSAVLSYLDDHPRADVIIRSHAHYYMQVDNGRQLGFILPALQAPGTKYGARRMSGSTSFGVVEFQCTGGITAWQRHLLVMQAAKPIVHTF